MAGEPERFADALRNADHFVTSRHPTLSLCPTCPSSDEDFDTLGDGLFELELAVVYARETAAARSRWTGHVDAWANGEAAAGWDREDVTTLLRLRSTLEMPTSAGRHPILPIRARHTDGPLGTWWADQLATRTALVTRARAAARAWLSEVHDVSWSGPLVMVTPQELTGPEAHRTQWRFPSGGLREFVTAGDLVTVVQWSSGAVCPVVAVPAGVPVAGSGWVSLGPPQPDVKLATFVSAVVAVVESAPGPLTPDVVTALLAATREVPSLTG